MSVKIGTTDIVGAYLGTTPVERIYVGTSLIWPSIPTAPLNVTPTVAGNDVTLDWDDPAFVGNGVDSYVIQRGSLVEMSDQFNRANNTDLGPNWNVSSGWARLDLVSNGVQASHPTNPCVEQWNGDLSSDDQWALVTTRISGAGNQFLGLLIRGVEGVRAEVGFEIDTQRRYDLVEFIGGSHITRAISAVNAAPLDTDLRIRGEVLGDQAFFYVNGELILFATLTTRLTGRRARFGVTEGGAIATRFDNFYAGGYVPLSWATVATVGDVNTHTLVDEPDGRWVYRIAAVNSAGQGPYSNQSGHLFIGIDTEVPATVPGAPAVSPVAGDTQVSLTWATPSHGGSPITDYDVDYKQTSSGTWLSWPHTGTALSAVVTGLTNGTSYDFRVRAENAVGEGAWSTVVSATPAVPGLAADDFNRANGALGANWVTENSPPFVIDTNRARTQNGYDHPTNRWSSAIGVDCYCEVDIVVNQTGDWGAGPMVRMPMGGGNSGYELQGLGDNFGGTSGWSVRIVRMDAGSEVILGSNVAFGGAIGTYTLRIEAEGDEIRGYVNGVLRQTITDDTYPSNTGVGMRGLGTDNARFYFDNFEAAEL